MNLNIDFKSKVPLYFQLKEQIKQNILDGKYNEGDLIPSEREFSDNYELSSTTIRRALNDLVQENFLARKAGKGTFVRRRRVKRDLRKVLGFTKNMTEMGLTPTTKVLTKKVIAANAFARERLGLKKGEKVVRLERLRLADDVPMMLETRYIRTDLCPNIEKEELSSSLWRVFEEKYGLKPNRHSQGMKISTVSGHAAANLTLNDNSLVFMIKGVTYVQDNEPIECEESLYRSDKYELTFEAIVE
ncbi:Predicted transcriptional regulator of N-Acetylglucosamine utilization, GntR family [Olavius sp. associated proteobacterium Delta 1]|nr:Predicted transcriptional regulator of N-Acetylglucosamine utilization, GntR family [Olavius sp. associated proteobacterium Delta 1]